MRMKFISAVYIGFPERIILPYDFQKYTYAEAACKNCLRILPAKHRAQKKKKKRRILKVRVITTLDFGMKWYKNSQTARFLIMTSQKYIVRINKIILTFGRKRMIDYIAYSLI